jgi:hypothetical protein
LSRDLPIPLAPELQLGERETRRMLGTIVGVEDETAGVTIGHPDAAENRPRKSGSGERPLPTV